MKRRQTGVGLSGLLVAAVLVAVTALLGMKVVPEVIEYFQVVKTVHKVAQDPNATSSVSAARAAFDRQANIDNITSISGADLEITKENEQLVLSFEYERRIHLFGIVSLLLDFQGSSKG